MAGFTTLGSGTTGEGNVMVHTNPDGPSHGAPDSSPLAPAESPGGLWSPRRKIVI